MVRARAKHAREFIEIIFYAGDKNADAPSLRHSVCVCIIIVFVTDDWRADGYRWRQGGSAKSNVFSDPKLVLPGLLQSGPNLCGLHIFTLIIRTRC